MNDSIAEFARLTFVAAVGILLVYIGLRGLSRDMQNLVRDLWPGDTRPLVFLLAPLLAMVRIGYAAIGVGMIWLSIWIAK